MNAANDNNPDAANPPDVSDATMDQTYVPGDTDQDAVSDGDPDTGATVVSQSPAANPSQQRTASAGQTTQKTKAKRKATKLGEFTLIKKLGQGGMGEVFLAKQEQLDRKVAIKILSKQFAEKEDFVKRFYREARSMAKLDHPNIVRCYAVGNDKGYHYVAIEFVDGKSMQDWMDKLGQLSLGDALHVTLVACEALKHAHDLNMIHRDIKPDNILLTKQGVVKVADMGLAKAVDEDTSMTQSGTGMGTPLYMAPEQARNAKHVDQRADIYALGCTLYHFLTGQHPFQGENTMELLVAKEKGTFINARKHNSEIPERLDLIIDKMIAKDPNYRYADCGEIMRDIESLGRDNASLEFIAATGVEPAARKPGGGTYVPSKLATPTKSAVGRTSQQDAARAAAEAAKAKTWIVRFTNAAGKTTVAQLSYEQISKGIRGGTLDTKTKAKTDPQGEFLPLAQFPEFTSLMQKKVTQVKAEAKAGQMQDIYKKIDKQYGRRKIWRKLHNLTSSVAGLVSLLIWLAVLIAVGYLAWRFVPQLYQFVATKWNLS